MLLLLLCQTVDKLLVLRFEVLYLLLEGHLHRLDYRGVLGDQIGLIKEYITKNK